jgi:alkylation response protein AidB-like acyl-CoA dehydrogenase
MPRLDTETLDLLLSTVRDYAERELTPEVLLKLDHEDTFPAKVLRDLYDPNQIGLHLVFVPEEAGGLGGSAYDIYRLCVAMAEIDLGVATGVLATCLGADPIMVGATPEQKTAWMTRVADEGLLMAYGATEPQAGSDLAALQTTATPVVEDGKTVAYRLNGRKQWISNGGVADLYTILANAPGGPSWFVAEKGLPGFTAGKPEDKHGIRASNTAALFLEDVLVPTDRLVGGVEGKGLTQAQAVFGYTRLMVAAFGLGAGWEALRRAIRYAQTRIQGGAPLSQKQGYTHKLLVPNAVRLEAARAYIEWTADRLDGGEPDLATEGAVAKYMATEAGCRAADDAIQALGGYGYTVHGREDPARRPDHDDLRGHLGDPRDDDRPRPVAAAPEVERGLLPGVGVAARRDGSDGRAERGRRAPGPRRPFRAVPARPPDAKPARPVPARGADGLRGDCGRLLRARGLGSQHGVGARAGSPRDDGARLRARGATQGRVRGPPVGERRRPVRHRPPEGPRCRRGLRGAARPGRGLRRPRPRPRGGVPGGVRRKR